MIWANATGAALLDAATVSELIQRRFASDDRTASEVARLAATLSPGGAARLERLRGFGTGFLRPLTADMRAHRAHRRHAGDFHSRRRSLSDPRCRSRNAPAACSKAAKKPSRYSRPTARSFTRRRADASAHRQRNNAGRLQCKRARGPGTEQRRFHRRHACRHRVNGAHRSRRQHTAGWSVSARAAAPDFNRCAECSSRARGNYQICRAAGARLKQLPAAPETIATLDRLLNFAGATRIAGARRSC